MAYHIFVSKELPGLEIRYVGQVSPKELAASVKESLALTLEHRPSRILTDCSLLEGGHNALHLFHEVIEILNNRPVENYREAIVEPKDPAARELVRFWETACLNRGITVHTFPTRETAIAWLSV